jgi:hypothetical protein
MPRSPGLGRLLGLAGVAVWLTSPPSLVRAQVEKSHLGARPTEKAPAEDKGPPRVSVLRLQVVKPAPGPPEGPAGLPRRHRFGFEAAPREGTSLTFMLDEPQQSIVGVETRDCKITKFRDDKGTDLAPDAKDPVGGEMPMNPPFGPEEGLVSAEVDPAGHRATVTVHSPRFPAGGANRLLLEAILVLRYARGERTVEQKNVNLKLDKLTAGPYSLVVMSQDDSKTGFVQGGGTQVILFHQGPLRDIKKVAFIGPDGQEIAARASGSGQSGSVYQTYYSLSKHVETCTIRLTAPETIETVNIAIAVNTGIGFPPFASRRTLPATEPRPTATVTAPK